MMGKFVNEYKNVLQKKQALRMVVLLVLFTRLKKTGL